MLEANILAPFFEHLGYSRHAREFTRALIKQGVKVYIQTTEINPKISYEYNDLYPYVSKFSDTAITIHIMPSPALFSRKTYSVLFTTTESRAAHPGLVSRAKMFDEIWVPCKQNVQALRRGGLRKKHIEIIPEGVDTTFWHPVEFPKFQKYTFLYTGDWNYRKGIYHLLRVWTKYFSQAKDLQLIVLTNYGGERDEKAKKRIYREAEEETKPYGGIPGNLKIIVDDFTDMILRDFYNASDVFIMPSLGEAWCLPAMESCVCGTPCILPDYGGHREWFSKRYGLLTTGYFDKITNYVKTDVDFYEDVDFYFPHEDSLLSAMFYAILHKKEMFLKGITAAKEIPEKFPWAEAAKKTIKRLQYIYSHYQITKKEHKLI